MIILYIVIFHVVNYLSIIIYDIMKEDIIMYNKEILNKVKSHLERVKQEITVDASSAYSFAEKEILKSVVRTEIDIKDCNTDEERERRLLKDSYYPIVERGYNADNDLVFERVYSCYSDYFAPPASEYNKLNECFYVYGKQDRKTGKKSVVWKCEIEVCGEDITRKITTADVVHEMTRSNNDNEIVVVEEISNKNENGGTTFISNTKFAKECGSSNNNIVAVGYNSMFLRYDDNGNVVFRREVDSNRSEVFEERKRYDDNERLISHKNTYGKNYECDYDKYGRVMRRLDGDTVECFNYDDCDVAGSSKRPVSERRVTKRKNKVLEVKYNHVDKTLVLIMERMGKIEDKDFVQINELVCADVDSSNQPLVNTLAGRVVGDIYIRSGQVDFAQINVDKNVSESNDISLYTDGMSKDIRDNNMSEWQFILNDGSDVDNVLSVVKKFDI